MTTKHIQHLYRRIGFGIVPSQLQALSKKNKKQVINALFKASTTNTPLKIDTSEIESILKNTISNGVQLDTETRRKVRKLSKKKQRELNVAWINRLTKSKAILREKMTLFWANHFVCKDNNIIHVQQFNNTLRTHALGNFKDFVNAISKEAAMTKYLNTKQNKKQKPNENFARELMELFTLGVGQYTENDIKESAKAFTGYSHNLQGEFVFKKRNHDHGLKTFFGKTGAFSGAEIVDMILEKKACAHYICGRIYRYFVNDTINETHVKQMTEVFYNGYDIEKLMHFVLMADWFYAPEHIGTKIKSPIEFIVGLKTIIPITFKKDQQLLLIQRLLGQTLLDPPNVAGWKGGKNWIDSNTIVLRLKLPSLLLNNAYISTAKLGTQDANINLKKQHFKTNYKRFNSVVNWDYFETLFKNVTVASIDEHILACPLQENTKAYLAALEKVSKQEYCIQLMSLPEYQMC